MGSDAIYRLPLAQGPPGRVRPKSAAAYVLPGPTWCELQSNLKVTDTCAGLGSVWERPSCKPRQAAASACLGPVSKRYRACLGHKLFERF